jgi:ADP-ribose pyrophosphatase
MASERAFTGGIQMGKLIPGLLFVVLSLVIAPSAGQSDDAVNKAKSAVKGEAVTMLSQHQAEALDAYQTLQKDHPELFKGRVIRPLVLDRDALAGYAIEHKVVLGVAAETPYVYFINDLVESRASDGTLFRHPYLRVVSRGQLKGGVNVVVLATIENSDLGKPGSVILVTEERHALGAKEIELPRGFGEPGLSGEANALKELVEETGYIGERAYFLGSLNTDSGLTDSVVSYYHVPVLRRGPARPETEEAISKVSLLSPQDIWKAIRSGDIKDGFTAAALALYEDTQRGPAESSKK